MYAPFGQGPAPHARWPSTKQEVAEVTVVGSVQSAEGPSSVNVVAYPTAGKLVEYVTSAVFSVRMVLAAAESAADIFDRSRFGIAMAAMIKMIATTIRSSMSEKPFCLRIVENLLWKLNKSLISLRSWHDAGINLESSVSALVSARTEPFPAAPAIPHRNYLSPLFLGSLNYLLENRNISGSLSEVILLQS